MSMNIVEQALQQVTLGSAVRQNHALEHATIALLNKRYPEARLSGISFAIGYFVFGEVPTAAVTACAEQALSLLRGGQPEMAIHERCGTNLAVAATLTGFSAMSVARMRRPFSTFNNVVLASMLSLVLARPLGLLVQKYITTRTPADSMRVVRVRQMTVFGAPAHFVSTDNPSAHLLASPSVALAHD